MASQEQMARAARIGRQLGSRLPVPHSLYKSLLALVESDEKPGPRQPAPTCKPVSDARTVLSPPRPAKPVPRPRREADLEGLTLW